MQAFTTIKRAIDKVMEWCCILILAVMTVLVTYQVVTRYFFDKPSAISEAMAQYLFVWLIMFGGAYVFGLREHLSITVLKDKLSPSNNMIAEIVINIVLFLFALSVMVMGGWQGSMKQMYTVDAALQIPVGVIYIAVPLCGAVMLFYAVYNSFLAVHEYRTCKTSSGNDTTTM